MYARKAQELSSSNFKRTVTLFCGGLKVKFERIKNQNNDRQHNKRSSQERQKSFSSKSNTKIINSEKTSKTSIRSRSRSIDSGKSEEGSLGFENVDKWNKKIF